MTTPKRKDDQTLLVEANFKDLFNLYKSHGFEVTIYGMDDEVKTWAVMEIKHNGKLRGAHIFQDGKMVETPIKNK